MTKVLSLNGVDAADMRRYIDPRDQDYLTDDQVREFVVKVRTHATSETTGEVEAAAAELEADLVRRGAARVIVSEQGVDLTYTLSGGRLQFRVERDFAGWPPSLGRTVWDLYMRDALQAKVEQKGTSFTVLHRSHPCLLDDKVMCEIVRDALAH
jgi:hypothetical protein